MRAAPAVLLFLASLTLQSSSAASQQPPPTAASGEVLAADTPRTTVEGNKFIAPAGWRIEVRGPATILTPPEGDSHIALVDVKAKDADAAVAAAWAAYRPEAKRPLKVANDFPDEDGWSNIRDYSYQTSPNEKRDVSANARRRGDTWTVVIYDMDQAVGEKRGGQVALIFGRLFVRPWRQGGGGGRAYLVLYDDRGYRGQSYRVERESHVLSGVTNRAESVHVSGGSWELCDRSSFGGRCVVVSGNVPDLSSIGLGNRVASARLVPTPR